MPSFNAGVPPVRQVPVMRCVALLLLTTAGQLPKRCCSPAKHYSASPAGTRLAVCDWPVYEMLIN
jgi:hypothetical protein